ncbi:MAG: alpha/beta fold hydrolase [Mariprofundus sp.]|nr:alpha/beta fold hydrolase [Mariprofundus sp.]
MKPLVFIHGWAQSKQVWYQQQHAFPTAHFLNLPGHGGAADKPAATWVDYLAEALPDAPCTVVGWSLGGMLAINLAQRFPERITGLALVASTPHFTVEDDWPYGCDNTTFAAFHEAVSSTSARQLNRFFSLMLHGDGLTRSQHNQLARLAIDRSRPTSQAGLLAGLTLLAALDFRASLNTINTDLLLLHGENDAVISVESSRHIAEQRPAAEMHFFNRCGHAPFLTQPDRFNSILKQWWQQ